MFLERVARHYQAAGWQVQVEPVLEVDGKKFRPDLLIQKSDRRRAILVRSEEPPGPFAIADFGARCRKLGITGVVVCPDDAATVELCEQARLEFVAGETIGDTVVIGEAPPVAPIQLPRQAPVPAPVEIEAPILAQREQPPLPWWRWVVVALIWAAALAVVAYDVSRLT